MTEFEEITIGYSIDDCKREMMYQLFNLGYDVTDPFPLYLLDLHNVLMTQKVHEWMKNLNEDDKMKFAINWRNPHMLFRIANEIYPGNKEDLQDVNWYAIFVSQELGTWEHGGKVYLM